MPIRVDIAGEVLRLEHLLRLLKALWGGHTAALQFMLSAICDRAHNCRRAKESRQCKIGDRSGDDIEGGQPASRCSEEHFSKNCD